VDLDVIFLGTAGSVPSATRQTAATLVRRGGERILIDCGEGTQRRLMQSVAGLSDIDIILITHETVEKNVNAAIAQIEGLATVVSKVTKLRMEALN